MEIQKTPTSLPLLQIWKNRNHKSDNSSLYDRCNIKFSIISKQSMPFLDHGQSKQCEMFKSFKKNQQKQNASFYLLPSTRFSMTPQDQANKQQKWRKQLKLQKLRNKRNYERHRLKLEYENLRINSIIECAAQQLIQKQNKMLNGMI